jgi:hypothetical protein
MPAPKRPVHDPKMTRKQGLFAHPGSIILGIFAVIFTLFIMGKLPFLGNRFDSFVSYTQGHNDDVVQFIMYWGARGGVVLLVVIIGSMLWKMMHKTKRSMAKKALVRDRHHVSQKEFQEMATEYGVSHKVAAHTYKHLEHSYDKHMRVDLNDELRKDLHWTETEVLDTMANLARICDRKKNLKQTPGSVQSVLDLMIYLESCPTHFLTQSAAERRAVGRAEPAERRQQMERRVVPQTPVAIDRIEWGNRPGQVERRIHQVPVSIERRKHGDRRVEEGRRAEEQLLLQERLAEEQLRAARAARKAQEAVAAREAREALNAKQAREAREAQDQRIRAEFAAMERRNAEENRAALEGRPPRYEAAPSPRQEVAPLPRKEAAPLPPPRPQPIESARAAAPAPAAKPGSEFLRPAHKNTKIREAMMRISGFRRAVQDQGQTIKVKAENAPPPIAIRSHQAREERKRNPDN